MSASGTGSGTRRRIAGFTVQTRLVNVLVPTATPPGNATCATNPTTCCPSGSGSGGSGSGSGSGVSLVYISGCAYGYPQTIYGTWGGFSGSCSCFVGSFPLTWNGTAWVGTFTGCGTGSPNGPITVTVTPPATSAGTWAFAITGTNYTFITSPTYPLTCGVLFNTTSITVSGACSGATQLGVTV
jgi:hypothetical protein